MPDTHRRHARHRAWTAILLAASMLTAGCLAGDPLSSPQGDDPITVEHALGTTTLEQAPDRVVALEWSYVETLLALGIQPVGVADVDGYERLVNTTPGLPDDVADVGTRQEPNLETIATLDPDLIVGVSFRHEPLYDELSSIAPTVVYDPWPEEGSQLDRLRATIESLGTATGRSDEARRVLGDLDTTIEDGRERLEAAGVAGDRFVLSQLLAPEYGAFRLFQDHHAAVETIEALGLENAWQDERQLNGFSSVGLEALERVEDAHFLYVPGTGASLDRFEGNPAWDGLTFVQEHRTYNLSGAWLLPGPLSGQAFVELVVDALAPETGAETIQHDAGETRIEGTPERVVALEWRVAEDALALGVDPVGVAGADGYESWVGTPPLPEDVTDVGTRQEPSLERIATLEPDLILGVSYRHEPIYEDLSSIAPTLLFDPYPSEDEGDELARMTGDLRTIADALDREERAQSVLEEMNATFASAADRVEAADRTGEDVVLAATFTHEGSPVLRLFTNTSIVAQVADRLGLENAWEDGYKEFGFSTVGLEALERVENATFLYTAQQDDDPINGTFADDPAWENLTFVREDRVHPLGGDTWAFGGPVSTQQVAERLASRLAR